MSRWVKPVTYRLRGRSFGVDDVESVDLEVVGSVVEDDGAGKQPLEGGSSIAGGNGDGSGGGEAVAATTMAGWSFPCCSEGNESSISVLNSFKCPAI